MLQNTAQHSNTSEPFCTLCMCYKTQHNTVTHQNHSVHCACVTKHSNTSEPPCTLCTCYKTKHNSNTSEPFCTLYMCYKTQDNKADASLPKRRIAGQLSYRFVFFCHLFSCIFEHPMVDSVNNRPASYPVFSVTDGQIKINPVNKFLTINPFCSNDTAVHP